MKYGINIALLGTLEEMRSCNGFLLTSRFKIPPVSEVTGVERSLQVTEQQVSSLSETLHYIDKGCGTSSYRRAFHIPACVYNVYQIALVALSLDSG